MSVNERRDPLLPGVIAISHPPFGDVMLEISLENLTRDELLIAPVAFRDLCRMTSINEAISLCESYGGQELYIPTPEFGMQCGDENSKSDKLISGFRGELKDSLSPKSYQSFLSEWGGNRFTFPRLTALVRLRRNKSIRASIDSALSNKESMESAIKKVTQEFGLHRRHIYRILKSSI